MKTPSLDQLLNQLLARPEIQQDCREIWHNLLSEEQTVLFALSTGQRETTLEPDSIAYLERSGLLVRRQPGAEVVIFSPIFTLFVRQNEWLREK
jgi:hypothetical protein